MELALKNGFNEMSQDDMEVVDGGLGVVAGIAIGCAVGWVVDGTVEAFTGKSVGGWVSTGINWVRNQF